MKTFKITYRDYWSVRYTLIEMSVKAKTKAKAQGLAQEAINGTNIGTASVIVRIIEVK